MAVCTNGDVVSHRVVDAGERLESPKQTWDEALAAQEPRDALPNFCYDCGAPVLTKCAACDRAIPLPPVILPDTPAFCGSCGQPFPWASPEQLISKLYSLLETEPNLAPADRRRLREEIDVLAESEDSAQTRKRKKSAAELLSKMAPEAWNLAQPVLRALLTSEMQTLVLQSLPHLPH